MEKVAGESDDLLPEPERNAPRSLDVVQMEVIAAVGRGASPGGELAVKGGDHGHLVGRDIQDVGHDLSRGRLMGLAAARRSKEEADGSAPLQPDGCAVHASASYRLLHGWEDGHVPGGVSPAP